MLLPKANMTLRSRFIQVRLEFDFEREARVMDQVAEDLKVLRRTSRHTRLCNRS